MLLKMYFSDKRNNKNVRVKIIKKKNLINDLKVKMLLEIDIIKLKKINIIILRN